MKCPYCDHQATKVVDSRDTANKVRRRRECSDCGRRFTTYETAQKLDIEVVKRGGEVEEFQEEKIRNGVEKAVKKTSAEDDVDEIVEAVTRRVSGDTRIRAEKIGEAIKKELLERDEVAYVRFASVYDSFKDVESFQKEVESLQKTH